MQMLKHLAPFAVALGLSSGCLSSPNDGQTVAARETPVDFAGYIPTAETEVTLQAFNPSSGDFESFAFPQSAAAEDGLTYSGIEWFSFTETTPIPNHLWTAGPLFGHFARVRATTDNALFPALRTFLPGWFSCLAANPGWGDFSTHCPSRNSPQAFVYTSDFLPNIDLVVDGMNYNSTTQTAHLAVRNVGRAGTVARIECFGLHSTIVAEPDVVIGPGESQTISQWIPTPSGHLVTCTVFGEGMDGAEESTICDLSGPIITCSENTGQTTAP